MLQRTMSSPMHATKLKKTMEKTFIDGIYGHWTAVFMSNGIKTKHKQNPDIIFLQACLRFVCIVF